MKRLLHKCFVLLVCLFLCSCQAFQEDVLAPLNLWKPTPYGIGEVPKGGTPEFEQGWRDGCDSGLAAYGGSHYRNLGYKFKQDWKMINNKDYYQAWQDSYLYCRWYIWNYVQKGSLTWTY